jgi:GT2 family glycosyltransferase
VGAGGAIRHLDAHSISQRWCIDRRFIDQKENFGHPFLPSLATANAAYRRSALEEVGGFDAQLLSGGDIDLSWRVQTLVGGQIAYQAGAVVNHQIGRHLGGIASRSRRYAAGHALLATRWDFFDYGKRPLGSRIWTVCCLPIRVVSRLLRDRSPRFMFIDAISKAYYELGLLEGRRQSVRTPLEPLPGTASKRSA